MENGSFCYLVSGKVQVARGYQEMETVCVYEFEWGKEGVLVPKGDCSQWEKDHGEQPVRVWPRTMAEG